MKRFSRNTIYVYTFQASLMQMNISWSWLLQLHRYSYAIVHRYSYAIAMTRMVVPQLQQMYQNSLMIARTKSKKVQNAKNQLAASGVSLAIMPDKITKKRDMTDDINMANTKKQKNVKKKRAKKISKKDDNDGRDVSSREDESGDEDDEDDDNITLAALKGKK